MAEAAFSIALAAPEIDDQDVARVVETLRSGWLTNGRQVPAFERELAEWVGASHAVAVANGTAAITLALEAAGIEADDEVIVPSFTYPATAHAVMLTGARPMIVDVEATSWNLDPQAAARAVTARTRAVMPVDQFGLPVGREAFAELRDAEGRPLTLIEDAACALGAELNGQRCGGDAYLACISFHPRKILTTGEGGAVLTRDDALAKRLRRLRNHGRDEGGRFVEVGGNFRMPEMAAALGRSQLERLDRTLAHRRGLAARYCERLEGCAALTLQQPSEGALHSYQTFALCLEDAERRESVIAGLAERGIQSGIATYALHREPPYRERRDLLAGPFPVADHLARAALALPLHVGLATHDIDSVSDALLELVA